jgi:5-methylcytosine-specific restriction protein A
MFEIGLSYKRTDLYRQHGKQRQGGSSTINRRPFLFLFTAKSRSHFGYEDSWQNGEFIYTGEGQTGERQFKSGNKAVQEHVTKGKALHLFEQEKKGYVRYKGEFALSSFEYREGKDKSQQARRTIVFHLNPVSPEMEENERYVSESKQGRLEISVDDLEAMKRKHRQQRLKF